MTQFRIYRNPSDYPGVFVVRELIVQGGRLSVGNVAWHVSESLEEARRSLPEGVFNIGRAKTDHRTLVEVWV